MSITASALFIQWKNDCVLDYIAERIDCPNNVNNMAGVIIPSENKNICNNNSAPLNIDSNIPRYGIVQGLNVTKQAKEIPNKNGFLKRGNCIGDTLPISDCAPSVAKSSPKPRRTPFPKLDERSVYKNNPNMMNVDINPIVSNDI